MNYENKPCPVCGKHMHEEDDIVVCPECATPQHRSCWMETGHCINENLHASGYVWSTEENNSPKQNENTAAKPFGFSGNNGNQSADSSVICHVCGSENPFGSSHCGHCGAVLKQAEQSQTGSYSNPVTKYCTYCGAENEADANHCKNCGAPLTGQKVNAEKFRQLFGIDEEEEIDGIKAGKYAAYLKSNVAKYLDIFKDISEKKDLRFNWAAFFLGPIWFFYRRIYSFGLISAALLGAAQLVLSSVSGSLTELLAPFAEDITNGTLSQEATLTLAPQMMALIKTPLLITLGMVVVINFVFAISANLIYFKKIKKDITIIEEQVPDDNMKMMLISRRGGRSVFSALCGYFAYDAIGSILLSIAEYIRDKM